MWFCYGNSIKSAEGKLSFLLKVWMRVGILIFSRNNLEISVPLIYQGNTLLMCKSFIVDSTYALGLRE